MGDEMIEVDKLKKKLGKVNFNLLKKYNFIIAGGAITSIFTNRKVNDFDVYARKESDIIDFLKEVWGKNCKLVYHTKKATLIELNDVTIHLIHFKYFEDVDDVFETFDFSICMGAFDFADKKFHLHRNFLKHNSQRILVFNPKTAYPIISAIRIDKYKRKGYEISTSEYFRILLACMSLKINTFRELKEHLGGMYGASLDERSHMDGKFNLERVIRLLSKHNVSSENETKLQSSVKSLDDLIKSILRIHPKYFEFKGKVYRLGDKGRIVALLKEKEANHVMIDVKDVFQDNMLYKFVKKHEDGTYRSYYSDEVKYCIGEVVTPISNKKLNGRIYVSKKEDIRASHYYSRLDKVLLEIAYTHEDLVDIDMATKVTISKGYVVREVPHEEWKKWQFNS